MTTKKKLMNFGLAFKLLVLVNMALVLAEICPEGQFKSSFIFGCSDCPDEPKTKCQNEGRDAKNCETSCIKRDLDLKSSTGINPAIPIGISLSVLLLIIIILLMIYAYKKRNKNKAAVENDNDEFEVEPIGNENTVNDHPRPFQVALPPASSPASPPPSDSPPASPGASESDRFFSEGVLHDLNKETRGSLPGKN